MRQSQHSFIKRLFMSSNHECNRCGAALPPQVGFCPHCGHALRRADLRPADSSVKSLSGRTAVVGSAAGGCLGLSFGIWLILIGALLTLTGIGAIIGLPLIIAGLLLPFFTAAGGGAMGKGAIKGKCVYCGWKFFGRVVEGGITCPSCQRRMIVRNKQLLPLN